MYTNINPMLKNGGGRGAIHWHLLISYHFLENWKYFELIWCPYLDAEKVFLYNVLYRDFLFPYGNMSSHYFTVYHLMHINMVYPLRINFRIKLLNIFNIKKGFNSVVNGTSVLQIINWWKFKTWKTPFPPEGSF